VGKRDIHLFARWGNANIAVHDQQKQASMVNLLNAYTLSSPHVKAVQILNESEEIT
jgi:hypothetical protein